MKAVSHFIVAAVLASVSGCIPPKNADDPLKKEFVAIASVPIEVTKEPYQRICPQRVRSTKTQQEFVLFKSQVDRQSTESGGSMQVTSAKAAYFPGTVSGTSSTRDTVFLDCMSLTRLDGSMKMFTADMP
ncbi:MAG: hypothetical protein IBJ03_15815 [Gemmatimonadaceae bacterium]|nr:hypothetical protein [Gemmatimonadaceae bacterium]